MNGTQNRPELLWLDDIRDPFEEFYLKHITKLVSDSEYQLPVSVVWIKNYDEFKLYLRHRGLPELVSFDHDLADEHYDPSMLHDPESYNEKYDSFQEKTGYDCLKYLCQYCQDNVLPLPKEIHFHTANPVGKQNMISYLENFKKHIEIDRAEADDQDFSDIHIED